MKIFKYHIPVVDCCRIDMPKDAEILSFQSQHGELVLWAVVNPDTQTEERYFSVIGTGHDVNMDNVKKYIGTTQIMGGSLIWHLFEMKALGER